MTLSCSHRHPSCCSHLSALHPWRKLSCPGCNMGCRWPVHCQPHGCILSRKEKEEINHERRTGQWQREDRRVSGGGAEDTTLASWARMWPQDHLYSSCKGGCLEHHHGWQGRRGGELGQSAGVVCLTRDHLKCPSPKCRKQVAGTGRGAPGPRGGPSQLQGCCTPSSPQG